MNLVLNFGAIAGGVCLVIAVFMAGRHSGLAEGRAQLAVLAAASAAQEQRYDESSRRLSRSLLRMQENATQAQQAASAIALRPYYRGRECLDVDGVRLANDALAAPAADAIEALSGAGAAY